MPLIPSTADARAEQIARAKQVTIAPLPLDSVRLVTAADVSSRRGEQTLHAALVTVFLPGLEVVEQVAVTGPATYPYVPGLLSYREAPPVMAAFSRLVHWPDALICDGHGQAHPRRFGLACHLGFELNLPTIGCAKSLLVGQSQPLGQERGATAPVYIDHELVGLALRTQVGVKPVYLSVGHRCRLSDGAALALALTPRYRLPLPIRLAHALCNAQRRETSGA